MYNPGIRKDWFLRLADACEASTPVEERDFFDFVKEQIGRSPQPEDGRDTLAIRERQARVTLNLKLMPVVLSLEENDRWLRYLYSSRYNNARSIWREQLESSFPDILGKLDHLEQFFAAEELPRMLDEGEGAKEAAKRHLREGTLPQRDLFIRLAKVRAVDEFTREVEKLYLTDAQLVWLEKCFSSYDSEDCQGLNDISPGAYLKKAEKIHVLRAEQRKHVRVTPVPGNEAKEECYLCAEREGTLRVSAKALGTRFEWDVCESCLGEQMRGAIEHPCIHCHQASLIRVSPDELCIFPAWEKGEGLGLCPKCWDGITDPDRFWVWEMRELRSVSGRRWMDMARASSFDSLERVDDWMREIHPAAREVSKGEWSNITPALHIHPQGKVFLRTGRNRRGEKERQLFVFHPAVWSHS